MPQRAVFLRRMIIKRNMIDTKFGGPKNQQILCSSDYNTPKMYQQYYRNNGEDPWLSYKHHGTASMMYGENGMFGYIYYFLAVARSKFAYGYTVLYRLQWSLGECPEEWNERLDFSSSIVLPYCSDLLIRPK